VGSSLAADILAILDAHGRDRAHIVPILSAIQDRCHYLPEQALRLVAKNSSITLADLEGVSTFYPRFRREPSGLHRIRVCVGTACHVKGGETIYDAFRDALTIQQDADTDPQGLFTVEKAACLGCCMLAPVAQIDDDAVYGHLTRQSAPQVLRDFLEHCRAGGEHDLESPGDGSLDGRKGTVSLCTCTSCRASGAQDLFEAL
jgi:NADH-quinone oxidoreductase subunit F